MAVIVAACLALSMGQLTNQHSVQQTVTANGRFTLGTGRYVKVNTWTAGSTCADLKVQYTVGTTTYDSDNLPTTGITAQTPYYFKAHGLPQRQFFMAYTLRTGFTTCAIAFNARVKSPEQLSCVLDGDLQVQLQGGDEITARTGGLLPRHHQRRFVRESGTIPNNNSFVSSEDADANVWYFPLGSAPQLEIGCMQVYTTPSQFYTTAQNPTCRAEMLNTDAVHTGQNHAIVIKDSYDCSAFTDLSRGGPILAVGLLGDNTADRQVYGTCCAQTNATSCNSLYVGGLTSRRACFWVEEDATCYPEYSAHYVDVKNLVGLNDTVTFASPEVARPMSTYVSDPDTVVDGYQGVATRKWFLTVQNNIQTTFPAECGTTATVSFVSATTGGLCEPSSRRLCDNVAATCVATPQNSTTPLYWEAAKTGAVAIQDDKFHTCNCLKQREVCYRKGGCTSTKRYQLILQNCLDQGCGNYCNSGAGVAASLLMTVLAVLAVML